MKKLYIGISRDHSASMRGIVGAAMRDFNQLIQDVREEALVQEIDTVVSVVKCGVGYDAEVVRESTISSVSVLKPLTSYIADGNGTPLFESVGDLIEQFKSMPDADSPDVQFMIMAITDGGENSSSAKWRMGLKNEIIDLQRTDKWSFIFRVPKGYARNVTRDLSLHEGNIYEWDTTARGMETSTAVTKVALKQYFADAKAGVKSTTKFYTNLKDVSVAEIKANLVDISGQVNLWTVQTAAEGQQIRLFCEAKSGKPFLKGAAFYQLTKTEDEVQDYKQLAIRDKTSGAVYSGPAARQMLNLPTSGTVKVVPGDHGNFDLYIQSTSVNRKLPVGTNVLYWSGQGTAFKEGASAPVAAPALAPVAKKAANKVTVGSATTVSEIVYKLGYKAGRGKKRNATGDYLTPVDKTSYALGFTDGKQKATPKFA